MTVPTTTTFNYNRDQIIQFAMRKLGVLEPGATPDPLIVQNFSDSLNLILKSWITKGIKIWTIVELTLPLQANKGSYIIGNTGTAPGTPDLVTDKPMKLMQAWLRNTSVTPNNDIPLQVISQRNYNEFGSKFSTGTSNSVYMNVGRDQSTVFTYLTPDTVAAGMYQMHLLTQRTLYDVTASTDNLDVPAEWLYALGWALAQDQILDMGVEPARAQMIGGAAHKYLSEAEDFDTEYNSVYFTPDMRYQKR